MKTLLMALSLLAFSTATYAAGQPVSYTVNGEQFEGYYISPRPGAPLIFMIHDWDGITDYEIRYFGM